LGRHPQVSGEVLSGLDQCWADQYSPCGRCGSPSESGQRDFDCVIGDQESAAGNARHSRKSNDKTFRFNSEPARVAASLGKIRFAGLAVAYSGSENGFAVRHYRESRPDNPTQRALVGRVRRL